MQQNFHTYPGGWQEARARLAEAEAKEEWSWGIWILSGLSGYLVTFG